LLVASIHIPYPMPKSVSDRGNLAALIADSPETQRLFQGWPNQAAIH
jgi:hypothetical protein